MSFSLADSVLETSTTSGTGQLSLAGAAVGFRSFSVIGNNNTCYYSVRDQSGSHWEDGIGTFVSGTPNVLQRTTPIQSDAGAATLSTFDATVKNVFIAPLVGGVLNPMKVRLIFNGTVTYTPTVGANGVAVALYVECLGAGGGGGGGVTGATATSAGASGAGGSYSASFIVGPLKASYTVAVGGGGTGGAAGNNAGAAGGATTFDSPAVVSALGGAGGVGGGVAGTTALVLDSGSATGFTGTQVGDIQGDAGFGTPSIRLSATQAVSGGGGAAPLGGQSQKGRVLQGAGFNGLQYGGGGSGALSLNGGASVAGGNGANGLMRIWEFLA